MLSRKIGIGLLAFMVSAQSYTASAAPASVPPAAANSTTVMRADAWLTYGVPVSPKRDSSVVGSGSLVVPPLAKQADPWTSGAVLPIPQALAKGQRLTVAFWAKAVANETVRLNFQAREAPYAAFFDQTIDLTPKWQRFVHTATAPASFPAGSQQVSLQLGDTHSAVVLGPVVLFDGRAGAAQVTSAFAKFRPDRVAEAVSIPSDPSVTLAGTLRFPVGHGAGPFPLAICVQGHGRNGRGGFDVLMDRLLADGIATLEYDKRGIASSTGIYSEDVEALTRDAEAAVAAMRRRPEIDGSRIAIVGHSQGGAIAPAVAAADPKIAGIVTFAGPVGDGLGLFSRSMHDQLISAGRTEATVNPLVEATTALIRARVNHADEAAMKPLQATVIKGLIANGFTATQAQGAIAAVESQEIDQISRTHIASDLKSLHIPVLELFGSLDPLVQAAGNAAAAREALAHNTKGKVEVFEGLSHWFKEGAKTGSEAENAALGPNISSPRAVKLAGDWLRDVLRPVPRTP